MTWPDGRRPGSAFWLIYTPGALKGLPMPSFPPKVKGVPNERTLSEGMTGAELRAHSLKPTRSCENDLSHTK